MRAADIIAAARETAAAPDPMLRDAAAQTMLDGVMTAMLGHTAPEVERLAADGFEPAADQGATLLALPYRRAAVEKAASLNAVALCWFELDSGFRHAGCHVSLHILPALLAASEVRGRSIAWTMERFIFCYEVLARLAMEWDTRPSGIHSHAVFSHLGAALAVCAANDEDDAVAARALDLASSAVNCGQSWEVSEGGELRNLWPGMAAMQGFLLHRAAKAGVATAPERLERSFDALFRRRDEDELQLRFAGPALLQNYVKLLPACRHLHAAVEASLCIAKQAPLERQEAVASIEVRVHREAAALLSLNAGNLINAQFSLPICVAVALAAGRFDTGMLVSRRRDPAVLRLAERVRVASLHGGAYPEDRAADVTVVMADGRRVSARVAVAKGDPIDGVDAAALVERKGATIAESLPPARRDAFLEARAGLAAAFADRERPIASAFGPRLARH